LRPLSWRLNSAGDEEGDGEGDGWWLRRLSRLPDKVLLLLELRVTEAGRGPEEVLERVHEEVEAEESGSARRTGFGLGAELCQSAVEATKGQWRP